MAILDPVKLTVLTITVTSLGYGHLDLLLTHRNDFQGPWLAVAMGSPAVDQSNWRTWTAQVSTVPAAAT